MQDPVLSNENDRNWKNADFDALASKTTDEELINTLQLMRTMKKLLRWSI